MVCPKCCGTMKVIAFITDNQAIDRIIAHLKPTFVAGKPPPSYVFTEVALMTAEENADYFWSSHFHRKRKSFVFQAL
jgi:hypothetical protein